MYAGKKHSMQMHSVNKSHSPITILPVVQLCRTERSHPYTCQGFFLEGRGGGEPWDFPHPDMLFPLK